MVKFVKIMFLSLMIVLILAYSVDFHHADATAHFTKVHFVKILIYVLIKMIKA